MKPQQDGDTVWVPVSKVAHEYNRTPITIRRWCETGYALVLGYKVKKDVTGHWLVGVPSSEFRTFKTSHAGQEASL